MVNFRSCAGIMVDSVKKVWIDMNMGTEQTISLLRQEQPDACMITHYHLDHSIWTRHVKEHSKAEVFIPEEEEKYLTSLSYVIEHTAGVLGMAAPWQDFVVNTLGYRPLEHYQCYTGQTAFSQMVPEMVLIRTPGHSPGHTSFYFPDEKLLFSGDMGLDKFGPWYGWADGSILDIVDSIQRLDGLDIALVLTSHGGIIEKKDIGPAWQASLRHLITREKTIMGQLEKGLTDSQIIEKGLFYPHKNRIKEPMRSFLNMWDESMYHHHKRLIEKGGLVKYFPEIF